MFDDIPIPLPPPSDGKVICEPHKDRLPGVPDDPRDMPWRAPSLTPQQIVARFVIWQERGRLLRRRRDG